MAKKSAPSPHRVFADHGHEVLGVSCSGSGRVVSTSMGGTQRPQVKLWDPTGKQLGELASGTGCVCWYAEQSPDGRRVAAGFGNLELRVWEVASGEIQTWETPGGIVASLGWSPDGQRLFTGNCGDNTVRLWDASSGAVLAEAKTKRSATWFVAVSPDGQRAVSGSAEKKVHVWDLPSCKESGALEGHSGKILYLAFSPDGQHVASASQDRTVRLWEVATGAEVAVFAEHRKQVTGLAFFPDGKRLVSTATDGTLRVWQLERGTEERVLEVGQVAAAVAVNPEGEILAGCTDGKIRAFKL